MSAAWRTVRQMPAAEDFRGPVGNSTGKYETGNPALRFLLRRFFLELDATLEMVTPKSVLDVGCGEGAATEEIARFLPDANVVGVDDASLDEEWANRLTERVSFRPGSGYALPFEDSSVDLVCALEVLEHVERPNDVLDEMRRVSRGWILASVPNEPLWRISHMLAGRDLRDWGNTPGHINHWSRNRFRDLMVSHGELRRIVTPFPWIMVLIAI